MSSNNQSIFDSFIMDFNREEIVKVINLETKERDIFNDVYSRTHSRKSKSYLKRVVKTLNNNIDNLKQIINDFFDGDMSESN